MRLSATIALLALGLGSPALAEANVGVAAAVNQDARGVVGGNIKTISLGDSVVFNQRIETSGSGLVQVLLADGTTFMVGPNSNLVIDSFVYDPNAGTAQVTASFTKGVLRFIGGQTSKTENGVTINTPVGTMGIRGAMVDVVLDPPPGTPPHVDMLFGNEVTLEQGKALLGRLYSAGYSLALGDDGAFKVLKTPPTWGSQIQAVLAGKAGTTGGAPKGPSDDDVKNSNVAENNSGNGVDKNTGKPPLSQAELDALLYAAEHYDELRRFLFPWTVQQGFTGAVFDGNGFGSYGILPGITTADGETDEAIYAEVAFAPNGDPIGIAMVMTTPEGGRYLPLFVYDSTTGQVVASDGEFDLPLTVNSASLREANDTDRETLGLQCACDFIRWGFWSLDAEAEIGDSTVGLQIVDGTWVTGDLTTAAELDVVVGTADWSTTYATYSGDMVGTVVGEGTYTASGTFDMGWNFGNRDGEISGTFDDQQFFTGLTGSGTGFRDDGLSSDAAIQGGFVNNGSQLAGGVIGSFALEQEFGFASGIFMGVRGANGNYN